MDCRRPPLPLFIHTDPVIISSPTSRLTPLAHCFDGRHERMPYQLRQELNYGPQLERSGVNVHAPYVADPFVQAHCVVQNGMSR